MQNTTRLIYLNKKTNQDLNELWNYCFAGVKNSSHMNAHVPFALTEQRQLDGFLRNENGYTTWLIKRNSEQDIIGFIVHGNFFPGLPNNIGFNIGMDYIKNGYATEALNALIEYVKSIGLKETFGHCFESNIGSIHTMEKCNFINMGRTGRQFNGNYELKFKIEL
jgi:RimJ/RimL family protein N-acetyltransferase